MKLGHQHKGHEGQACLRISVNNPSRRSILRDFENFVEVHCQLYGAVNLGTNIDHARLNILLTARIIQTQFGS